jgi:hypothetical protein
MQLSIAPIFLAAALFALGIAAAPAAAQPECYRHQYLGNNPTDKRPGWHLDTNGIGHDDTHWYVAQVAGAPPLGAREEDGLPLIWRIPVTRDLDRDVDCESEGVSCISFLRAEKRDSPGEFLTTPNGGIGEPDYSGYHHVGDVTWRRVPRCNGIGGADCPGFLFTPIEAGGEPDAIAVFRYVNEGEDEAGARLDFVDHLPAPTKFWVGVDPHEGFLYTSERGENRVDTPFFKYEIDWERLESDLDLEFAEGSEGPWRVYVLDEAGNPLGLRNLQGGTFSDDGRLLYITNGRDDADLPDGNGGVHVFEVSLADGRPCGAGPGDCWATRVDHSIRSSSGCSRDRPCAFVFEWHRGAKKQEPQGITFFDLDAVSAPEAGGRTSLGRPVGGQLHGLMLDNNWPGEDEIFIKHYRLEETCEQPLAGIDVFPDAIDFGDVGVGGSGTGRVRISNLGANRVWLEEVALVEEDLGFRITSAPPQPLPLEPNETADVEIEFAPTQAGFPTTSVATTNLDIRSNDPEEPLIEVALAGRGISLLDQTLALLEVFDEGVALGELLAVGSGNSAEHRREALRNMLEEAVLLLEGEFVTEACGQLHAALMHADGFPTPGDFVAGPGSVELAEGIREVRRHLGCGIPSNARCGLGFELAFLLPPLLWFRNSRRARGRRGMTVGRT